MPKFAANLTTMYHEFPVTERFSAAASDGFTAVEFLFPYSHDPADLERLLRANGLALILINTPLGDAAKGERGLAALPGRQDEFLASFRRALAYAAHLQVPMIHVMAGVVPAGTGIASCESTFVDNLQVASKLAADSDIQLLLEPLNARDTPGYLITGTASARRLIERIGAHNVRLQYDFYHLQIMQGDLAAGVRDNLDLIGHIQFSSVPGRHEPQYGEVNLPFLFEFLDTIGYQGWVGCEYRARTTTRDGLTWTKGPHIRFA